MLRVLWLSLWHRRAMAGWTRLQNDHPNLKFLCSLGVAIARTIRLASDTVGHISPEWRSGSRAFFTGILPALGHRAKDRQVDMG